MIYRQKTLHTNEKQRKTVYLPLLQSGCIQSFSSPKAVNVQIIQVKILANKTQTTICHKCKSKVTVLLYVSDRLLMDISYKEK